MCPETQDPVGPAVSEGRIEAMSKAGAWGEASLCRIYTTPLENSPKTAP